MALFTEILGALKGDMSGAQKLLNFSQVRKFHLFIRFFYICNANNSKQLSHGRRVYAKKIASTFSSHISLLHYPLPGALQQPIVNEIGCAFAILCSLQSSVWILQDSELQGVIKMIKTIPTFQINIMSVTRATNVPK